MSEQNGNSYNGNGPQGQDSNVVHLPSLAERQRMQREEEERAAATIPKPKILNLPPATKTMLITLLVIHAAIAWGISEPQRYDLIALYGFIPGYYTGTIPFAWHALLGPFTYSLLHGSWMHVAVNGAMLMAFGSGVERWIGGRRFLILFILCALGAAAAHLLLNPFSQDPMIGASGGLSGLFAAIMVLLNRNRESMGMPRSKMMPFILVWIAVTVASGMMGVPNGGAIAWAAHVGGFLTGFAVIKLMRL